MFDALAASYDSRFGASPSGRLSRFRLAERVTSAISHSSRVLDVGCGTGEDALWLARVGHTVHGIDPSSAMVETAAAKAARAGSSATFARGSIESFGGAGASFDVVLSNFGAMNCASLSAWSLIVPNLLRSGGRGVVVLLGAHPLPDVVRTGRASTLRIRAAPVRVGEGSTTVEYASVSEVVTALRRTCTIERVEAVGCLVPAAGHVRFARENPGTLGLLAMIESLVRRARGFRNWGDHTLFEFRRR